MQMGLVSEQLQLISQSCRQGVLHMHGDGDAVQALQVQ